jgi:hypothetical protein
MKTRNGFVSNSSSSSFVCDVSGNIFTSGDYTDHSFRCDCCNSHFLGQYLHKPDISTLTKEQIIEELGYDESGMVAEYSESQTVEELREIFTQYVADISVDNEAEFCIGSVLCPICNMVHIDANDLLAFVLKRIGISKKDLEQQARLQYSNNYKAFKAGIK